MVTYATHVTALELAPGLFLSTLGCSLPCALQVRALGHALAAHAGPCSFFCGVLDGFQVKVEVGELWGGNSDSHATNIRMCAKAVVEQREARHRDALKAAREPKR